MITPLMPYPAAMLRNREAKTLVISDLHIGWEIALSESGIHVPTQTHRVLKQLKNIINHYKPDELLILGDVKHSVASAEISEWQDIPEFFDEIKKHVKHIEIIPGNHDGNLEPLLPEGVELKSSAGTIKNDVGLFHGHRWPSLEMLKCKVLVMGHVHPVISLRDPAGFRITQRVWVKAEVDGKRLGETMALKQGIKADSVMETLAQMGIKPRVAKLFIMPSFSEFLGGKPLNLRNSCNSEREDVLGPVLRSEAVKMDNSEIYLLDGTFLGFLGQIKRYA